MPQSSETLDDMVYDDYDDNDVNEIHDDIRVSKQMYE